MASANVKADCLLVAKDDDEDWLYGGYSYLIFTAEYYRFLFF